MTIEPAGNPRDARALRWFSAMAAIIVTLFLTALLGKLAHMVPILCLVALLYAFARPRWQPFGARALGIKPLLGWTLGASLIGVALAAQDAADKQALADAQRIVAVGKVDRSRQTDELALADERVIGVLQRIAPELATQQKSGRWAAGLAKTAADDAAAAAAAKQFTLANGARIAAAVKREKMLKREDLDDRIAIYRELVQLAPADATFKESLSALQMKQDRRNELKEHPERGIELVRYDWRKSGFGAVMMLDATVRNDGSLPLKDFTLFCEHSGPSGTVIDSNTRVVFELIAPGKTRRLRNINMGFIQSQATRSLCEITDAKLS